MTNVKVASKFQDESSSPHVGYTRINCHIIFDDSWDWDINMLPYEPTSEECAIEQLDEFIGSQIPLETKEGPVLVKVVSRKRDSSGKLSGAKNVHPTLDTRRYTVEFPDGHFEEYSCNILS